MNADPLTERVIGAAIKVHRALGPGLLESAYQSCFGYEMVQSGLRVVANRALPIVYGDLRIQCAYRMDFVIEDQVVVEIKSVARLEKIHVSQLLTYLKLSDHHVGLLINFNVSVLQHGIRRIMNYPPP